MKLKDLISKYGECEVSEEMLNMIKKDSEGWKPEYNEDYWFINDVGNICRSIWENLYLDKFRLQKRNVYRTEEEARFALGMYRFCKKRSFEPDWNDFEQIKWSVKLDYRDKNVKAGSGAMFNYFEPFYYPTKEEVQEVIGRYTFEELEKYYGRV